MGFLVILIWNVFGIFKLEVMWKNLLGENVFVDDFCYLFSEGKFIIMLLEEKDVGMWMLEVINFL